MAKSESASLDVKKMKKAPYNPRTMGAQSKSALKSSIQKFDDISGIVVNERTGNILAGNHRWEQLGSIHGTKNLTVSHLSGEYHQIMNGDEFTGFLMRIVDWPEEKEKAANIAANSQLLAGEFTSGLQEVIMEVQEYLGDDFENLRFDEMSIDFGDLASLGNQGISDPDAMTDRIRKNSEDNNLMLDVDDEAKDRGPGEVKIVQTSIKILVPGDKADMIREDIIEYLSQRPYYDELEIS